MEVISELLAKCLQFIVGTLEVIALLLHQHKLVRDRPSFFIQLVYQQCMGLNLLG